MPDCGMLKYVRRGPGCTQVWLERSGGRIANIATYVFKYLATTGEAKAEAERSAPSTVDLRIPDLDVAYMYAVVSKISSS